MRVFLESTTPGVTGKVELQIPDSKIEITEVYWKNREGKRIDKLIPKSKAILCVRAERFEDAKRKEVSVKLKHQSGAPVRKKFDKTEKITLDEKGYGEKEYQWDSDDTIIATVKGKNEKDSPALVKEWGIWVREKDNDELHFFNPNKPYLGTGRFIKSVYEAYFYFKKVNHTKVFDEFIMKKNRDVFVKYQNGKDRGTMKKNDGFDYRSLKKQFVGEIGWDDREGILSERQDKTIIAQSPATVLLHELGHAYFISTLGINKNKELDKTPSNDPYFTVNYRGYRLEEINVYEIENPAAKAVGEGERNRYKAQYHPVKGTTEKPDIKQYSKF